MAHATDAHTAACATAYQVGGWDAMIDESSGSRPRQRSSFGPCAGKRANSGLPEAACALRAWAKPARCAHASSCAHDFADDFTPRPPARLLVRVLGRAGRTRVLLRHAHTARALLGRRAALRARGRG